MVGERLGGSKWWELAGRWGWEVQSSMGRVSGAHGLRRSDEAAMGVALVTAVSWLGQSRLQESLGFIPLYVLSLFSYH